ncbi:ABC transporter ATP-binding protein [Candidatus Gracilibacteria bacterium]|nr:ABC transporter ATP-binding protein [Candidatus Gracilibacteria bacterium]
MTYAIEVNGLGKRYGTVKSLSDVSFNIPAGSISGFLGENGAGKSTALRILAGLTHASTGGARINGVPVSAEGHHRLHLGFLAQEPRFYSWMSAREVLCYVASFYGKVDQAYVERLLRRVGIHEAADRPTGGFSGGMRQRLGIAQALIGRPAVVLLDEPASALDPVAALRCWSCCAICVARRRSSTRLTSWPMWSGGVTTLPCCTRQARGVGPHCRAAGRFTAGQILVRIRGEADLLVALRSLPGVSAVTTPVAEGEVRAYELSAEQGAMAEVQRQVTRLAAERGLALLSNEERRLDLEAVFLRLIGARTTEQAAGGRTTKRLR